MKIMNLDDLTNELVWLQDEKIQVVKSINILKTELTDTYRRNYEVDTKLENVIKQIEIYKQIKEK